MLKTICAQDFSAHCYTHMRIFVESPYAKFAKMTRFVTLVPVRALSGTHFLSVRELTENEYLILCIKKGLT